METKRLTRKDFIEKDAKVLSCLRVAVGFNISEKQQIKAKITKGEVILGEVVK